MPVIDKSRPSPKGKPKRRKQGQKPSRDWAPQFLEGLMVGMTVTDSCKKANVHITTVYQRGHSDDVFRKAWNDAADIGTRSLEQEAARRAYHGTLKPVFHKGEECGAVREYSDSLMMFLLKARRPKKYREGGEDGRGGSFVLNVAIVNRGTAGEDAPPAIEVNLADAADGHQQDGRGVPEAAPVP